ncbi:MAG TPA: hypothetical protein VFG10_10030 [Saprospiraceae bacterium]|nr:hypothetical protein [Saprospiraceae bacterium]
MEEKELTELIDHYLFGRIRSQDLARLEYLRKTNPDIDLQVRESLEAFRLLKYLRYKQLRQKLQQIDATDGSNGKVFMKHRWMLATVLMVASFLCLWLWTEYHYAPESVASRYFKAAPEYFMLYQELNDEDVSRWVLATNAFDQKNFQLAIDLFHPFENYEQDQIAAAARWNALLAYFALHGPGVVWKEEVIQFQANTIEPFRSESIRLLRTINSPWYRFFISRISDNLSALKPRLM